MENTRMALRPTKERLMRCHYPNKNSHCNMLKIEDFYPGEQETKIVDGKAILNFLPSSQRPTRRTNCLEQMKLILTKVCKHPYAWPFIYPVNTQELNLGNYHQIIKHPMDMNTIRNRLKHNWYYSFLQCIRDVKLVFTNCYFYNDPSSQVVTMAKEVEKFFGQLQAKLYKMESVLDSEGPRSKDSHSSDITPVENEQQSVKGKLNAKKFLFNSNLNNQTSCDDRRCKSIWTFRQLFDLSENIRLLDEKYRIHILNIVLQNESHLESTYMSNDIEVDLRELQSATLLKIENYVNKELEYVKKEFLNYKKALLKRGNYSRSDVNFLNDSNRKKSNIKRQKRNTSRPVENIIVKRGRKKVQKTNLIKILPQIPKSEVI